MHLTKFSPSDWRINLFGPYLQENRTSDSDEENPLAFAPTATVLDPQVHDYIAVFVGANYCPHCRELAPAVLSSAPILESKHKVKTIFVSNDRDEESFQASVKKNLGVDVVPYDLEKTRKMRDLFQLTTIPAFMILKNDNFQQATPTILTNARIALVDDPEEKHFPWEDSTENSSTEFSKGAVPPSTISTMDRFIIRGKYGQWWELGHHANPVKPDQMYMDEHAVRARAGLINIISWIAAMNIFFWKEPTFVIVLFPLVAWEMLASMTIGLTPLAPIGMLGTALSVLLHPEPYWKPAKPKRFAWLIGLTLACLCLTFFLLRFKLGDAYRPLIGFVVITCNVATWFETSCGFCFGCFIYNNYMVKFFDMEECQECKI